MWVSRTNTEIAVPQWSTLCVDVERTSKGAELHTAIPSLSSRLSDSWFPSKHPVRCQNPHFVIYPGDLVHLQSAILSTIYSLGKRLALEQGRSLNPPSGFTAQFIQIDKSLKERMEVESSCRAWSYHFIWSAAYFTGWMKSRRGLNLTARLKSNRFGCHCIYCIRVTCRARLASGGAVYKDTNFSEDNNRTNPCQLVIYFTSYNNQTYGRSCFIYNLLPSLPHTILRPIPDISTYVVFLHISL